MSYKVVIQQHVHKRYWQNPATNEESDGEFQCMAVTSETPVTQWLNRFHREL